MMKTCSICGNIHDINKICRRKTTKKETASNKFRKTSKWAKKSINIRKRDNYLCQICISGKYNTINQYTYKDVEVHHIIPVELEYSKRLDDTNLITLCRYHHEMAEKNEIPIEELQEIVARKY